MDARVVPSRTGRLCVVPNAKKSGLEHARVVYMRTDHPCVMPLPDSLPLNSWIDEPYVYLVSLCKAACLGLDQDAFQVVLPLEKGFNHLCIFVMQLQFSPQIAALWKGAYLSAIWIIWHFCNRWIFEEVKPQIALAIVLLRAFIIEMAGLVLGPMSNSIFDLICLRKLQVKGNIWATPMMHVVRWHTPLPGWMKVNTDGCVYKAPRRCVAAGVYRNCRGFFTGCFIQNIGVGFAFQAELMAAIFAIERGYRRGWRKMWLESDSTYVCDLLSSRSLKVPWKYYGR
ncbi:hypothetical protein DH2020_027447 [Rehmannia glutinosa]|uniref:RNase H type-1 domain-containing protein n=1 Tax=Rehmannia glutinosa TaxID=99300 RepID=A0ABR0VU64_REHGL